MGSNFLTVLDSVWLWALKPQTTCLFLARGQERKTLGNIASTPHPHRALAPLLECEVVAHVHLLWHFLASLCDAVCAAGKGEPRLCRKEATMHKLKGCLVESHPGQCTARTPVQQPQNSSVQAAPSSHLLRTGSPTRSLAPSHRKCPPSIILPAPVTLCFQTGRGPGEIFISNTVAFLKMAAAGMGPGLEELLEGLKICSQRHPPTFHSTPPFPSTHRLLSVSDMVSASLDMLCCSLSLALVAGARA